MNDYEDDDFTDSGYWRVYYGHVYAPNGPYDSPDYDALYEDWCNYPSDGYIVFVDNDGSVSGVPSLPGRACAWGAATGYQDCGGPSNDHQNFNGSPIELCDVHQDPPLPEWLNHELDMGVRP